MQKNTLLNHFRCFGFLFRNHGAVHFLVGFAMTVLFTDQPFVMALFAGALVFLITGFLNLLTYFWRHRYRPKQLMEHHLGNLLEQYGKRPNHDLKALQRDLECLLLAPYLNPSQRERVAGLYSQLHLQPIPAWHLRHQLEQLLHA